MNQNVYIVGIEGGGTSALARLYHERGAHVSGSDDGDGFYGDSLKSAGITVHQGFDALHVPAVVDCAIRSTAFGEDNPEIVELLDRGIPVLTYPEALGKIIREHYGVAVCGTHGKTTTTGFLTHAMIGAGRDPSAIVGAPVVGWDGGTRVGSGQELIFEADEYQNKLALYDPQSVIFTSCDYDHPDFFPDFDSYMDAFRDFVARIPSIGFLVANADDADVMHISKSASCSVVTTGSTDAADCQLLERSQMSDHQTVTLQYKKQKYTITTSLPGLHNAVNAMNAWLLTVLITGNIDGATAGIATFSGTARRFQQRGQHNGALLIDDYAHHPSELKVTLRTARELYPDRRLIVAFHPHTFSRTAVLLENFARALEVADIPIVIDIYGSARENHGGVSSYDMVDAINQGIDDKAQYIPSIEELAQWARDNLTQNDIFLTCGAGDIWKVHNLIGTTDVTTHNKT